MSEELTALASDLVFERKRLSESLRRLEAVILHSELAKQNPRIHDDFEILSGSLDRVGALTKTLIHHVNKNSLVKCDVLIQQTVEILESCATKFEKRIQIDRKGGDFKVEKQIIEKFTPVLQELITTFVEYCIESQKERALRGKRAQAILQIEMKIVEDAYRMTILCDGNGLLPPLVNDIGKKLAQVGVRANFEGRPGKWSAWLIYLPTSQETFRCAVVRVGNRKICIPAWALVAKTKEEKNKTWGLGESLGRFQNASLLSKNNESSALRIGVGTEFVSYIFDEVIGIEEVYMKPLQEAFSGNKRFLGVVLSETDSKEQELSLVMNPAYLVYGESCFTQSNEAPNSFSIRGTNAS